MAQRRREHVELEQLAVAVRHLDGLLPVELQLQSGRVSKRGCGSGPPEAPTAMPFLRMNWVKAL